MKFLQFLSYAMAPAMASAAAIVPPRAPSPRSTTSSDAVTKMLAEASYNASIANYTIQPIPKNGSISFDHQGNPLPLPKYNYTVSPSTYSNSTAYQRCKNANNCEPVHHANGWRPSFKEGYNASHPYGNGTASRFARDSSGVVDKRQFYTSLAGSSAKTSMNYGNVNPCTAFNYAYYVCGETNCQTNAATLSTEFIQYGGPSGGVIQIYASGQYKDYNMRDFLIGAAVTAAGQGQTWTGQYDTYGDQLYVGSGLDSINMALYDGDDLEGFMTIWTQMESQSGDICDGIVGVLTDVIKLFDSQWGNLAGAVDTWVCDA